MDKCRILREFIVKEAEDLKQEKERFEKELDAKRSEINEELTGFENLKKDFEKLQEETENLLRREMDAVKAAQETFAVLSEKIQSEKIQLLRDFETQKGEFAREMRQKQEEIDGLRGKLKDHREAFVKERERFIAFVEQKSEPYCNSCAIRAFDELFDAEILEATPPLPYLAPGVGRISPGLRSKLLKSSRNRKRSHEFDLKSCSDTKLVISRDSTLDVTETRQASGFDSDGQSDISRRKRREKATSEASPVVELKNTREEDGESENEDDDNDEEEGEVSIGKKIWNFITT